MKCKNQITIAHYEYKNGQKHSVIEGSESVMVERIAKYGLDKSINGYYEHTECGGEIECSIYSDSPDMGNDCGDISVEFRCSRCGENKGELLNLDEIHQIINEYIKENI